MRLHNKNLTVFLAVCFMGLLFTLITCGSRTPYVGKYISMGEEGTKEEQPFIELKEGGAGIWRIADEEAVFRWNVKGREVRLHVKPSGVIAGKIKNDQIEIQLPGSDIMIFKREKPSR